MKSKNSMTCTFYVKEILEHSLYITCKAKDSTIHCFQTRPSSSWVLFFKYGLDIQMGIISLKMHLKSSW